jgi:hypothetical protein
VAAAVQADKEDMEDEHRTALVIRYGHISSQEIIFSPRVPMKRPAGTAAGGEEQAVQGKVEQHRPALVARYAHMP